MDEDWVSKDHPDWGKPTGQAVAAQEIKALYLWWTQIRPVRPDAYDVSGWSDYCKSRRVGEDCTIGFEDRTDQDLIESKSALDRLTEIEQQYEAEDESMMIRLIKIRGHLWT
jgi:hypothetical protein